jgi:septal ring factor EnvC (AmiA/AmiB activator)
MIRPVDYDTSQNFGDNPTRSMPSDSWLIQTFGNYQPDGHTGIDYPCPVGTPIKAVTSGTVIHVGYYGGSYADNEYWIAPGFAGYCYVIDHGWFIGIYAHGQENAARVSVGQWVNEGQVIGLSGNTGGSTGPHLHFEILQDGFVVNSYMFGRSNPAILLDGISAASQGYITPASEEDDLSAEFERDVRAQMEKDAAAFAKLDRDLRAQLNDLPALDRDLRADLAVKGRQIVALSSANEKLAQLLAESKTLDVEAVKQALASAVADGIKVNVTVGG